MRKILLVTTILLSIGFFIPNPVLAVTNCNQHVPPPPPNNKEYWSPSFTSPTTCPIVGVNEDMVIWAYAFDEDGAWLYGASVKFDWIMLTANMGTFTAGNGATCIGGTQCTETNTNGQSSINLHASNIPITSGKIKATATYDTTEGSFSAPKEFTINSSCTRLPVLYYGIASVSVSGKNIWQSSTAEVLETCRDDYKLYEGIGEGS